MLYICNYYYIIKQAAFNWLFVVIIIVNINSYITMTTHHQHNYSIIHSLSLHSHKYPHPSFFFFFFFLCTRISTSIQFIQTFFSFFFTVLTSTNYTVYVFIILISTSKLIQSSSDTLKFHNHPLFISLSKLIQN